MEKLNVLVTGAAGFIGSEVAKKMISLGYIVYTIDNLRTGYKQNIPSEVIFIEGNIQDENVINKLLDIKFEAIFHIAGQSSGEISFDDPVYDLQTNTQSTLLLLKMALKIDCTKFIYASTMSVYGDGPDRPVNENDDCKPKSFYAVGKFASEKYLDIYSKYGIRCTSLRLFNVYGPGQNMENLRQGMASIFLSQALRNKEIVVKGDIMRYRDMVFIDDVVNAFIASFNHSKEGHKIVNICTGAKTKVSEILDILEKRLDFPIVIKISSGTPGDIFGIYGSNDKALLEIGWKPEINFQTGFSRMIEWAKKN